DDVDEAAALDWRHLYLKVYRLPEEGGAKLGDVDLAPGDLLEVAGPAPTEAPVRTWNGRAGRGKRVSDGGEGTFAGRDFLRRGGGLVAPYDAFPSKYVELKQKLLDGEVVDLWGEELVGRCGEPIVFVGEWQGAEKLHFELFSSALIPMKTSAPPSEPGGEPTWTAKEQVDVDTGDDRAAFLDRATFLDQFFADVETKANEAAGFDGEEQALQLRDRILGDTTTKEDGATIKEGEIQAFFQDPANSLLPVFRNLVVRHLSEWGTKCQWENLAEAAQYLGQWLERPLQSLGEATARYAWWSDGFGEEAGLPSDQVCHFYHPITFLRWLEHERQLELPSGQG